MITAPPPRKNHGMTAVIPAPCADILMIRLLVVLLLAVQARPLFMNASIARPHGGPWTARQNVQVLAGAAGRRSELVIADDVVDEVPASAGPPEASRSPLRQV
jgi:hypothetical protein